MQKEFLPNIEYNRKRRRQLFVFYILLTFLCGGFALYMFMTRQFFLGGLLAVLLILLFSLIPSSLAQYPIKEKALIKIDGKDIILYTGEVLKASDILGVSVSIGVPEISKVTAENKAHLLKVAQTRPTEPIFGACDISVRDAKGKEVIKYHLIDDAIGALESMLELGVKRYRIVYTMKKLTQEAQYKMTVVENKDDKLKELTEKEKMMQLL